MEEEDPFSKANDNPSKNIRVLFPRERGVIDVSGWKDELRFFINIDNGELYEVLNPVQVEEPEKHTE